VENFLPEADQDYLRQKAIRHRLLAEKIDNSTDVRRGIEFLDLAMPANTCQRRAEGLVPGGVANVLVLIPTGYDKTRLDSWYLRPALFNLNGQVFDRAGSPTPLFGEEWQFWSRHLADNEWRPGIDGLETYLQYIRAGLRNP
jgi:hypothetical protein